MSSKTGRLSPDITDIDAKAAFFPHDSGCRFILKDGIAIVARVMNQECVDIPEVFGRCPVKVIANEAFKYNDKMRWVRLPKSLEIIGDKAFYGCSSLEEMRIPESVYHIGALSFYNCLCLRTLNLPARIDSVGMNPFINCNRLSLDVADSHPVLACADGVLFSKPQRRLIAAINPLLIGGEYVVPDGTVTMDDFSMCDQKRISRVVLPDSLKTLGFGCFLRDRNLAEIVIPPRVSVIPGSCFMDCRSLTRVILPERLAKIEGMAFGYCSSLRRIRIPPRVSTIRSDAFVSSRKLVVRGKRGSFAELFANENGVRFENEDDNA